MRPARLQPGRRDIKIRWDLLARPFWLTLGFVALVLGLVGIALPVLPTTPFVLLAAFAFGKSSPRLRRWLEHHPVFGGPIRDWETRGAIAPRHKAIAVIMMSAAFLASVLFAVPNHVLVIQAVCLGAAALFVLSRPSA
ncbi:YbaN family protein [uncultured Marivita sp.]|uniref:YbaN family protein n=1 Tax=uncultured Marivita sp. TaxID=888080 RepID=UPI0026393249|nr:YbaN family protein [uncultured Marivita sp.]